VSALQGDETLSFAWPDLLLEVDAAVRASGRLRLRFRGVVAGREHRDFGETEVSDPAVWIGRLGEVLDDWAGGYSDERSSVDAHLQGIGIELFENLIPPALQDHYWSHLHGHPGAAVLLLAEDEAARLPWEMVKPAREATVGDYWCAHFGLSRWVGSQPIATVLPGKRAVCVVADPELSEVGDPASRRLGVAPADVVTGWAGLEELLADDGIGLFHWTGHGRADDRHPGLSELPIDGETFRPVDILVPEKRAFLRRHPWVFLHACSTNRVTVGSVGLGGWPKELVERGTGAMLGAAWDVRAKTAARFADGLYERLLDGVPVARAVREARLEARTAGDPSWLAYQLYAHPAAQVEAGRSDGETTGVPVRTLVERAFATRLPEALDWRRAYLESLVDPDQPRFGTVPLGGSLDADHDLEYSTVYVEPSAPRTVVVRELRDIAEAVGEYDGVVLLGDSGAGKSATLRRIARDLAARALRGDRAVPTPVPVSLHEFRVGDDPLEYVRRRCRDDMLRRRLRQELKAGRICLLCDGLNETARHGYHRKIRAWHEFMEGFPGNRFVFACRSSAYRGELRLPEVQIAPLDDERILRVLFHAVGGDADELWQAIRSGGLLDIARMPLFLEWLVVSFQRSGSRLPRNRSRLLEGIVKSLVRREEQTGSYEEARFGRVMAALAELAHTILAESTDGTVPGARAMGVFEQCHNGVEREAVTEGWRFAVDAGFLTEYDERIRFRDIQLRDYFAAAALHRRHAEGGSLTRYCASAQEDPRDPDRGAIGVVADGPWSEAVVLASGLARSADPLLTEVCAVNPRLAAHCVARNAPTTEAKTIDAIRGRLLRRMADAGIAPGERIADGLALGRIGDPRFRRNEAGFVMPELCRIPAGRVWLGSDEADRGAFEDERPQHEVSVPAYAIGRYAVTNAEYDAFVDAGGYGDPRYWTEHGWAWRTARDTGEGSLTRMLRNLVYFRGHLDNMESWFEEADLPDADRALWRHLVTLGQGEAREYLRARNLSRIRSRDTPAFARNPALNGPNQPVVGVSWYEAMAYCAWLGEVGGTAFGLPTEAQWERAAKGGDRRIYPWGSAWVPDRCNARTSQLSRTVPVGVFPDGRSPFGCEDMAGNVAEWTSSRYRFYPHSDVAGQPDAEPDEVRVTRGGGWIATPRVVRCALRGDMRQASYDDGSLGFRVVAAAESGAGPSGPRT
jgi:formylglycine-generating enzyme required for sulfatase activity